MTDASICEALAICHVEFMLIHPFLEGNGRLARILATVMALQACQPLLNFGLMRMTRSVISRPFS
ncbi:MAG TPA: Fic family protein [Chloroflexi bacterium]|nr:Fic family protein [Chloroflexota bacterium]